MLLEAYRLGLGAELIWEAAGRVMGALSRALGVMGWSWSGPGVLERPLGGPREVLEEFRSVSAGLGGFWGQCCRNLNDETTRIFGTCLLIHVFLSCSIGTLYRNFA